MEKPQYCLFFSNAALLNIIENTTGQNLIFVWESKYLALPRAPALQVAVTRQDPLIPMKR